MLERVIVHSIPLHTGVVEPRNAGEQHLLHIQKPGDLEHMEGAHGVGSERSRMTGVRRH